MVNYSGVYISTPSWCGLKTHGYWILLNSHHVSVNVNTNTVRIIQTPHNIKSTPIFFKVSHRIAPNNHANLRHHGRRKMTISRERNVPRYPTPCFRSPSIFSCYGRRCLSRNLPIFSPRCPLNLFFSCLDNVAEYLFVYCIFVNVTNIFEDANNIAMKKIALDKTSCRSYLFAISNRLTVWQLSLKLPVRWGRVRGQLWQETIVTLVSRNINN